MTESITKEILSKGQEAALKISEKGLISGLRMRMRIKIAIQ